jgi:hypothetical protein
MRRVGEGFESVEAAMRCRRRCVLPEQHGDEEGRHERDCDECDARVAVFRREDRAAE